MSETPTILIVDDDTFVRATLRDILAGVEARLCEASDGEEAIAMAGAEKPAIVILDLFMPKKSGLEALSEILKASPASHVLVISSMDSESIVQFAVAMGARGFIAKPFHPVEILDAVHAALTT